MSRNSNQIGAVNAATGGRAARTFKSGRVCLHPDCETILSAYNPGKTCSVHSGYGYLPSAVPKPEPIPAPVSNQIRANNRETLGKWKPCQHHHQ